MTFLEHLNDKLSLITQPLLKVKGRLVLTALVVEQHKTHSCTEKINPVPSPWPKEEAGAMPTVIALEHSDGHGVCKGLAKHSMIFGRKEKSRVVRFPFFSGLWHHYLVWRGQQIRIDLTVLPEGTRVDLNTLREETNGVNNKYKCGTASQWGAWPGTEHA